MYLQNLKYINKNKMGYCTNNMNNNKNDYNYLNFKYFMVRKASTSFRGYFCIVNIFHFG